MVTLPPSLGEVTPLSRETLSGDLRLSEGQEEGGAPADKLCPSAERCCSSTCWCWTAAACPLPCWSPTLLSPPSPFCCCWFTSSCLAVRCLLPRPLCSPAFPLLPLPGPSFTTSSALLLSLKLNAFLAIARISFGKGVGALRRFPVFSRSSASSPAHFTRLRLLRSSSHTEAWKLPDSELLSLSRSRSVC